MSKSLKRVRAALEAANAVADLRETTLSRTAADAAAALGCAVDQIAKSIILRGETSGEALLFVTAGGQQVDLEKAAALAGEPLGKADAALIRAQTGFAIGGVSPVGHVTECTETLINAVPGRGLKKAEDLGRGQQKKAFQPSATKIRRSAGSFAVRAKMGRFAHGAHICDINSCKGSVLPSNPI